MEIESSKNSYKFTENYGRYNVPLDDGWNYINSVKVNNVIYSAPSYAKKWLKIDSNGSYELPFTDIDVDLIDKNRLTVLGANGKVYAVPYNTQFVSELDPLTDTIRHISGTGTITQNGLNYLTGTLASNGKIYCPSFSAGNILVIDTNIDEATYSIIGSGFGEYSAATEADNGKIYCVPRGASQILVIDTFDDSTYLIADTIPGQYSASAKSVVNGKIYSPPSVSSWSYILVIDPTDDSIYYLPGPAGDLYRYMQESTVAHPNGKIYSIPYEKFNPILVIDTTDDSTKWIGNEDYLSVYTIHLADNGKIYGANWQKYAKIVEIDPDTDTVRYLEKRNEWNGNMTGYYANVGSANSPELHGFFPSTANWEGISSVYIIDNDGIIDVGGTMGTFDNKTNTGVAYDGTIRFSLDTVTGAMNWDNGAKWTNVDYIPQTHYRYLVGYDSGGSDLESYQYLDSTTGLDFLQNRCDEIGGVGFLYNTSYKGGGWVKSNVDNLSISNDSIVFKKYESGYSNNFSHINNIGNDFYLIPAQHPTITKITLGDITPVKNSIVLDSSPTNTRQKIRYIRDYANGNDVNIDSHWVEINAYSNGVNVALNKPVSSPFSFSHPLSIITDGDTNSANSTGSTGLVYVDIDLEDLFNVDKIIVWHYYADGRTYNDTRTQVSIDGITWTDIFNSAWLPGTYPEPTDGSGKTTNLYTESHFKTYNNWAVAGNNEEIISNISVEEAKQHCINNNYTSFDYRFNDNHANFSYATAYMGQYYSDHDMYVNTQILPSSIENDTNYIKPIPFLPNKKPLNYDLYSREIQYRNSDTINIPQTVDFGGNTFIGNPPRPRVIWSYVTGTTGGGSSFIDVDTTLLQSEYYAPIIQSFDSSVVTEITEMKVEQGPSTWFFRLETNLASTVTVKYVAISK